MLDHRAGTWRVLSEKVLFCWTDLRSARSHKTQKEIYYSAHLMENEMSSKLNIVFIEDEVLIKIFHLGKKPHRVQSGAASLLCRETRKVKGFEVTHGAEGFIFLFITVMKSEKFSAWWYSRGVVNVQPSLLACHKVVPALSSLRWVIH